MKIEVKQTEVYELSVVGVQGLVPAFTQPSRRLTGKWVQATTWQPITVWFRWERVAGHAWRLITCGMRSQQVLISGDLGQRAKRTVFVKAGSHILTWPQPVLDLAAQHHPSRNRLGERDAPEADPRPRP